MDSIFDIHYVIGHEERLKAQLSQAHKPMEPSREPALTARQRRNMRDLSSTDKLIYLRNIGSKQA